MTLVNTPASACGDGVLRLQLRALGVEQREKVSCTLAIAHARDRGGAAALARLLGQLHQALLLLAVADERVLGLLERAQDDLLELRRPTRASPPSTPRRRARALPRSKAAQLSAGVTAQARESATSNRLPRPASRPRKPVIVMRG